MQICGIIGGAETYNKTEQGAFLLPVHNLILRSDKRALFLLRHCAHVIGLSNHNKQEERFFVY